MKLNLPNTSNESLKIVFIHSFTIFFPPYIVLLSTFEKASHFNHVFDIFVIPSNILHVALTMLSFWGSCPLKKNDEVFSSIIIWDF